MSAVTRPTVNVYDEKNTITGTIPMADVFRAPIRPDVINSVHTAVAKNKRQPYAVSKTAGHQTSAVSWGTGRAVARIPRVSGGGTHRAGQAAFGNMCRKGRMFAPTKIWRKWHIKISKAQKRFATCSAIAGSAITSLVMARGHRIGRINEIPLVITNATESFTKTKQAVTLLKKIKAYGDIRKARDSKKIRAGRGKSRNRRYTMKKGPLVVYDKNNGIYRAFRNLPGVTLCNVRALNILNLAPGGHLGRFIIWTQDAFSKLNNIFGTLTEASKLKKGFTIPYSLLRNPDIANIMKSDNIRKVLKKVRNKNTPKPYFLKKNPLTNPGIMAKLSPYHATMRRKAILENIEIQEKVKSFKAACSKAKTEGKPLPKREKTASQKAKRAHKPNKAFTKLLLS